MNDLSLHILDIIQNSLSAGASLIELKVWEDVLHNLLTITIGDNGKGMTEEQVQRVTDPFFTSRTTRKVGLGLPLYGQTAEQSKGALHVHSAPGEGTTITATFEYDHIDRPPLGDVANAVILMVSANPHIDFLFSYRYNAQSYIFDTREIKEALDGLPLNDVHIMRALTEMIEENMALSRE
jgi:Signal transduction histidine kinase